mgnify:CR=1 FL=1
MATKSIIKSICIKDKRSALKLADALERAEKKRCKPTTLSKRHRLVREDEVKSFFGVE